MELQIFFKGLYMCECVLLLIGRHRLKGLVAGGAAVLIATFLRAGPRFVFVSMVSLERPSNFPNRHCHHHHHYRNCNHGCCYCHNLFATLPVNAHLDHHHHHRHYHQPHRHLHHFFPFDLHLHPHCHCFLHYFCTISHYF